MSDDPFQQRLDSINREMAELLSQDRRMLNQQHPSPTAGSGNARGSLHRDPLDGAVQASSPFKTTGSAEQVAGGCSFGDGWGGAACPRPLSMSTQDTLRREVQQVVSREMKGLDDHVREMVHREWDVRVRELDAVLRNRFQELKTANDSLSKVVLEVAENFQIKLDELGKRVEQQEAEWKRSLAEVKRDLVAQSRTVQSLGDTVADVEEHMRADSRCVDQRVEAIVKRHGELVRSSLNSIDEKILTTQRELEATYRDARKQLEGETDGVSRNVNRLQGAVEASGAAMERVMHELQSLGEGIAANQSGLRSCRSEVNRLDVAMRAASQRPHEQGGFHGLAAADIAPLDAYRMQQDIFALKECVAYLHAVVNNGHHGHAASGGAGGFEGGAGLQYAPRQQQRPQSSSAAPLNANALNRPPYIASSRSTPTKYSGIPRRHSAPVPAPLADGAALEREGSGQWSDGNTSGNVAPSPTYRTVPDSDSEDERENSKLARSELD